MSARYPSIRIEGGLIGADVLAAIADGSAPGQKPRDFGLTDSASLVDQISTAWSEARAFWPAFERRRAQLKEGETGTGFTRTQWINPLLLALGYDNVTLNSKALEADGLSFAISHRAAPEPDASPIHAIGAGQPLDKRAESGRPRLAPHSLVQEYLNRTEHLWGIVTNGLALRLLRNSQLIRRQAYIEIDLQSMFAGEGRFADFAVFYRLLHRSRFPLRQTEGRSSLLERWFEQTIEQGGRVREKLHDGVKDAIPKIANGILRHPKNAALLDQVRTGELKPTHLYQELLRVIYRLLFLMVTEERNLLTANQTYRERYSISRLRRLCENRIARNSHTDLWTGLQSTFRLFHDEDLGQILELPPLNGELFDRNRTADLNDAILTNRDFLDALWHLSLYREERTGPPRHVNYSALDVEELGSVYEGLLELQPTFESVDGQLRFTLIPGLERKGTGSYYTPPQLVDELLKTALLPVLEARLAGLTTIDEKQKQVLAIRVCDPACGSGHFLLAAARALGRELARVRSGENEPSPGEYRAAVRDVIAHCIYGVDKNPLAVELCKVALWIESYTEARPLSFLDHRILRGNSLVGIRDMQILQKGIPEDAYKAVTGDDSGVAREARATNRNQLRDSQQMRLPAPNVAIELLGTAWRELDAVPDNTPQQIRRKREKFEQLHANPAYLRERDAADLWTFAFFARLTPENVAHGIPLTHHVLELSAGRNPDPQLVAEATAESVRLEFFHWPLEFPDVFAQGGFDVVLSNPPWERIKLQQQEFFASRDAIICRAANKAARERLIAELPERNPILWHEYRAALHDAECGSKFLRASGIYPDTARGDINTYSVFAERITRLVGPRGRIGAVLPTGIATDDTNKAFFGRLVRESRLLSLFSFYEVRLIFKGTDSRQPFCLLTLSGTGVAIAREMQFAFFLTQAEQLTEEHRIFPLTPDDFALLNPNTKTCPIFRTRADAELTRKIYRNVPVLVDEANHRNPWGVRFSTMFHMSNDSHLFRTRDDMESDGFVLVGNRFERDHDVYLPLYEAKMIHQSDHRWATYDGTETRDVTLEEKQSADCVVLPRYWVSAREVYLRSAHLPQSVAGFNSKRRRQIDANRAGAPALRALDSSRPS